MPVVERFGVKLPPRETVEVVVLELRSGTVIARTSDELASLTDEEIAAALAAPPASSSSS